MAKLTLDAIRRFDKPREREIAQSAPSFRCQAFGCMASAYDVLTDGAKRCKVCGWTEGGTGAKKQKR